MGQARKENSEKIYKSSFLYCFGSVGISAFSKAMWTLLQKLKKKMIKSR